MLAPTLVALAVTLAGSPEDTTPPPLLSAPAAPAPTAAPAPEGLTLLETVNGVRRYRHRPGAPVPEGFVVSSELRWRLLVSGVGIFVGGYGASAGFALLRSGLQSSQPMFPLIPVVGPLVQLVIDWANLSLSSNGLLAFFEGFGMVLYTAGALVMSGAQVVGVVLAIIGASTKETWLERASTKPVSVSVVPGSAAGPLGISVVGRF